MNEENSSRFARLQVELVVEITDPGALAAAALEQVGQDAYMPDDERGHTVEAIRGDATEALACLIDPFDLLEGVPGITLAQASWSCASTEYDPDSDWAFGEGQDLEDAADDGVAGFGEDGGHGGYGTPDGRRP